MRSCATALAAAMLVMAAGALASCGMWEPAAVPAPWANRSDHAQLTTETGSVVILGGGDYASSWTVYNDVWSSSDLGSTWTPVTMAAPWAARGYLTANAVQHQGAERFVVIAGGHCIGEFVTSFCHAFEWFADVWVSDDGGATWQETVANKTSPFAARGGHATAVVDDSLLFFGGVNGIAAMNDAWRSDDGGVTWTMVRANGTSNGPSSLRGVDALAASSRLLCGLPPLRDAATVDRRGLDRPRCASGASLGASLLPTFAFHNLVPWRGRLWAVAGASSASYVNTVWSSGDGGVSWRLDQPDAPWCDRILPATVVVPTGPNATGLLLTGGSPHTGGFAMRDVWSSADGANWTEVNASAAWPARGWQMMTTVPARVLPGVAADVSVVMTGGWSWYFPEQLSWTYFRDAWRCTVGPR